jgi:hypothetical protein
MEPTVWLQRAEPVFCSLTPRERKAVEDFTFLWTLYEGTVLNTRASATSIFESVNDLNNQGKLIFDPFLEASFHFRRRYYVGHSFTPSFDGLRLRKPDKRPLIERFVAGTTIDDVENLAALLIIVYRLRNNLFHGLKWVDGMSGQFENFRHANNVLMAAMDLHR